MTLLNQKNIFKIFKRILKIEKINIRNQNIYKKIILNKINTKVSYNVSKDMPLFRSIVTVLLHLQEF